MNTAPQTIIKQGFAFKLVDGRLYRTWALRGTPDETTWAEVTDFSDYLPRNARYELTHPTE